MRREQLFSRSGFYGFLLETNVLLHREAAQAAIAAFAPVLDTCSEGESVPVLDLACGGWPVTISTVMEAFPRCRFSYTGVDINPDQVELAAREFPFPDNVDETRLIEGNAWELDGLGLEDAFPLVFSGMNLHHGTPGEIRYLGAQLMRRMTPGGVFVSHDVYRPDAELYRPRPQSIDGETSWLVDPARIAREGVPDLAVPRDQGVTDPSWRVDYVDRMGAALLAHGGDPAGVKSTTRHMNSRDYPVSTEEFRAIMERLGFLVRIHRYGSADGPIGPYVATCSVTRPLTRDT